MHICIGNLNIIGSDNGLSPGRRQAIIWTNAGILLIGPLGTNFSEFWIVINTFSFSKMHLKMSSAKWRPFCLGLNVLRWGKIIPFFYLCFLTFLVLLHFCAWKLPHLSLYEIEWTLSINKRPVGLYSPLLIQIIQYCNKCLHVDASKTGWTPNKKVIKGIHLMQWVCPTYSLTVLSKRPFSLKQEAR